MAGTLYIVATPVGNLEDMTFRAVRTLREVDLIAAEDTRHSRRLLDHYGILTPTVSCHEHNEARKSEGLVARLLEGQNIALISDAGTPLISDPGYRLVNEARKHDIPVVPIPGCNAAITGLSAAGLPTDQFLFCGFPPKRQSRQAKFLADLADQTATLIFYESPRRITALIQRAMDILGDRHACLARELTKQYEEFLPGTLSQIRSELALREQIRGECVLFIQGASADTSPPSDEDLETLIRERLQENPSTSDLAKELARSLNLPKKKIYNTILRLKSPPA